MLDRESIQPVQALKWEFVRRLRKDGTPMDKVWYVVGYNRSMNGWELQDVENINHCIYLRDGLTPLFAGFTY